MGLGPGDGAVEGTPLGRAHGHSFVAGALILVAGSLGSRLLGATYRIILPILMGGGQRAAVGMGLYQMAYPMFLLAVTLITTGFPLAVSKLVAARLAEDDADGAHAVFAAARLALPVFGLLFAAALWFLAPLIAHDVAHDVRAVLPIRAISPAVLTVSFASAYRGAFQGKEDMRPYAVSQIIEQIGRVFTMFALVIALLPLGIAVAAAGASFGAVIGGIFSFGTCLWFWPRAGLRVPQAPRTHRSLRPVLGQVLGLAIPIALSASVLPLFNLSDAIIVPLRLAAAGLGHQAIALYGVLTGYASPLVLAPTVFTAALSMSLLPSVAAALASGDRQGSVRNVRAGLRLAMLFALPAAVGLGLVSGLVPRLLFHASDAARPLVALCPALVFLSLQQTSSGVLQGLGRPDISVRNLVIGGIAKVAIAWWLVGIPAWNVSGAAISTSVAFLIACVLNIGAVQRRIGGVVDWDGMLLRPALATVVMGALVLLAEWALVRHGLLVETGGALGVGVVGYVVALPLVGGLRRDDLELLPRVGPRVAVHLARWGLLRA